MDLKKMLPLLTQRAIAWAELQSEEAATGRALNEMEVRMARAVGVRNPERIRVMVVGKFPLPRDPVLRAAAADTGLLGSNTAGLPDLKNQFSDGNSCPGD